MTIATSYDERMALIKKIDQRNKKLAAVKKKTRKVRAPKVDRSFMDVPKESNMYQWTDASKYAKEYYGETMYHTTRFDNDWD
ncbi:hypothetical protein CMO86_08090 [Candidatus Woesearchaeota archaeon]|nr:hypothetical protein [Candidatus Woesearchaeota archaeon]